MGQGGGSPATPLTLREACAPPHPGLKPHGRLVAAPRAPSGARRCKSAPAVGNMRPAPALVLAALCLLALPAAAAASYFGSVPVASPLSACLVPVPIPARPQLSPLPRQDPDRLAGALCARISIPGSLSLDFTSLSRIQVPCPTRFLSLAAVRLQPKPCSRLES